MTGASDRGGTARRAFDWLLRDRRTGRVVVAQLPNLPLILFLAASALRRFADPHGAARTAVTAVAVASLLWWAGDEIVRGVNPLRRMLGAAVAVITVAGVVL